MLVVLRDFVAACCRIGEVTEVVGVSPPQRVGIIVEGDRVKKSMMINFLALCPKSSLFVSSLLWAVGGG